VGISSLLEHLAMGADGVLAAPVNYGTAGWFASGPQPGQPGPAVIAGHVDSRDGPAIFYRLGELKPGDEVLVHREDGSTVRFRVDDIEQYPKDAFPAESVYGPVPGPELRLITCGGEFDRTVRSYHDNLVVYATAVA
jgi:sortase (surface protein transpeptidase)